MNEQIEREQQLEANSLQIQKAAWIRNEIARQRENEDKLLLQIFEEQQMLQDLDKDMDQNMAHAKEGRKYREDMKSRVDDRVYEMHDLSADKREGMREYTFAYRRGYALAMFFFSLALCVFAGYLHGITSQIALMLMFFTGVQAAIFVHRKQCALIWRFVCDVFSVLVFPGMLVLFTGYELKYEYYETALPYCLTAGLVILALTTASYFFYDPYRSARRRVGDAKSMIRSLERSAKKQVKKNQKQQAKEEQCLDRQQKKESEREGRLREKEEARLEKARQKAEKKEEQYKQRQEKKQELLQAREEKKLELSQAWEEKKQERSQAREEKKIILFDSLVEKKEQLLGRFYKAEPEEVMRESESLQNGKEPQEVMGGGASLQNGKEPDGEELPPGNQEPGEEELPPQGDWEPDEEELPSGNQKLDEEEPIQGDQEPDEVEPSQRNQEPSEEKLSPED